MIDAKAHPPQMRQFQREGLNLGLGGEEFGIAAGDLLGRALLRVVDQFANRPRRGVRYRGIGHDAFKFSV